MQHNTTVQNRAGRGIPFALARSNQIGRVSLLAPAFRRGLIEAEKTDEALEIMGLFAVGKSLRVPRRENVSDWRVVLSAPAAPRWPGAGAV
jgi:hypothetical protein